MADTSPDLHSPLTRIDDAHTLGRVLDLTTSIMHNVSHDVPNLDSLHLLLDAATEQFPGSSCVLALVENDGTLTAVPGPGITPDVIAVVESIPLETSSHLARRLIFLVCGLPLDALSLTHRAAYQRHC